MAKENKYTKAMDNLLSYIKDKDEKIKNEKEKIQNEYSDIISEINTKISPRIKELYKLIITMCENGIENYQFIVNEKDKIPYGFFKDESKKSDIIGVDYIREEFGMVIGTSEIRINTRTGTIYYNGTTPSKKCNYLLNSLIFHFDDFEKNLLDYINSLYEKERKY